MHGSRAVLIQNEQASSPGKTNLILQRLCCHISLVSARLRNNAEAYAAQ